MLGRRRITHHVRLVACVLRSAGVKALVFVFPLIGPEEVIMEIKVRGSYPKWLADVLAQCHAYPCSFSKYGEAYKRCMQGGAEHAGNKGKAVAACA
ncbi:VTC domain-containing protein [Slackia sp.]|uniref:VTC domain-containing protein n=1 Tax=Slackia sp. TaxID=2049041 RepID=UPI003A970419